VNCRKARSVSRSSSVWGGKANFNFEHLSLINFGNRMGFGHCLIHPHDSYRKDDGTKKWYRSETTNKARCCCEMVMCIVMGVKID
jgi:hypothetical protein